ncbi:hypothetical protein P3S67_001790 [Capsicum chacoense]
MEKTSFLKVFLVSFFLILLGQGSNGGLLCNEDGDCNHQLICNIGSPVCDIRTRTCYCPTVYQRKTVRHAKTYYERGLGRSTSLS